MDLKGDPPHTFEEPSTAISSGTDIVSEKKAAGVSIVNAPEITSSNSQDGDLERNSKTEDSDDDIHHPANKDDILTHTIHVEDDPTLPALTFRTWFLGMYPNLCQRNFH